MLSNRHSPRGLIYPNLTTILPRAPRVPPASPVTRKIGSTGPDVSLNMTAPHWAQTPDFQLIHESDDDTGPVLVGFPFSGSGSAMFASWRKCLPPSFSLVAATLPGREERLPEPPWSQLSEAADRLSESLTELIPKNRPIIPVGFSIGALVAFEVTRRVLGNGLDVPLLVVASRISPTIETPRVGFAEMSDEEFVRLLADEFGAIPPEIAENEELLKLLLPALRGDLEMGESYQFEATQPVSCDVLAAHGSADESVRLQWLDGWSEVGKTFRSRTFAGGHFFVRDQTQAFIDTIATRYHSACMSRNI